MGERQDGDGVRCRNMNRPKPGISREVVRQRWRELCSGEMAAFWRKAWFPWVGLSAWKLEPLQPYNYVMGPGPLSTQESKCSWAPDAPTAWPVQWPFLLFLFAASFRLSAPTSQDVYW